ncbi:hypothetical protein C8R41DRAFT_867686 [Lentinula lateritia]|uniref:Uncharacterized protein n=1 Tax=Lentinula lateritia TaxID=40482 RepID=A0ABQ8VDV9_9AGAR|nr:hypothetical protein C8R41DRAFT_867686 [Lentinula lateritia]
MVLANCLRAPGRASQQPNHLEQVENTPSALGNGECSSPGTLALANIQALQMWSVIKAVMKVLFGKVWRRKAPTKGGLGACPQQAVNPAVAHGASKASHRGEGTGSKAC